MKTKKTIKVGDFVEYSTTTSTYDMVAVYPIRVVKEGRCIVLSINDWDEVNVITTQGKNLWFDLKDLRKL